VLLRDLTIENYRSFEKYRLDNLARVNLLVGDNNCGKTSVLDAVNLLLAGGDVGVLYAYLESRGEVTPLPRIVPEDRERFYYHIKSLFHGCDTVATPASIDTKIRLAGHLDSGANIDSTGSIVSSRQSADRELRFDSNGTEGNHVSSFGQLDEYGRIAGLRHMTTTAGFGNAVKIPSDRYFLPNPGLSINVLNRAWNLVQRDQLERYVVEALKLLDNEICDIRFQSETESRHDILVDVGKRRVALSTMGEGMARLLGISVMLASAKDDHLFIDEIDTGLHYSKLADMWKMVIQSAKNLDVQVFATTHSLDCIRGLAEAVEANPSFTEEVAIFRIDRREQEAVRFGGEELRVVVDHEIEVR
jgi:hypothetical protein